MKKQYLIFSLVFLWLNLFAQKHDYVWLFGYSSNPTDTTFGGTNMDFNSSPPDTYYIWRDMDLGSASASICDAEGNLLFYTNGCYISDANQMILGSINPGEMHDDWCPSYGSYPPNGDVLFLPTSDEDTYYLLHKDFVSHVYDNPPSQKTYPENIYYSKVKTGIAGVVEQNVSLLFDTLVSSDLTATKHANDEDWWFFIHKLDTNLYYKYLLTADTILGPYLQTIGLPIYSTGSGGGQAVFSPDGNTYVYYDPDTDIMIHDFDRETGLLSNYRHISLPDSAFVLFGGAAISSNSRFLYVSNLWDAYQFDLWEEDIAASKVHIGHWDGFVDVVPVNLHRMQLGPDCKIYMNSTNAVRYLHVIHEPNLKGLDCNLELHGLELPTRHGMSIPPFPNYRLGTGEVCDSTISVTSGVFPVLLAREELEVFPNPATDRIKVLFSEWIRLGRLLLYDFNGRMLLSKKLESQKEIDLELSHLPAGVYFGEVVAEGKRRSYFKVVVE